MNGSPFPPSAAFSLTCFQRSVERGVGVFLLLGVLSASANEGGVPEIEVKTPEQRKEEIQTLLLEKKWKEVEGPLQEWTQAQAQPGIWHLELAKVWVYLGRREEAVSLLRELAKSEKGKIRQDFLQKAQALSRIFTRNEGFQKYQDGVNLLYAGKPKEARERLVSALKSEPSHLEVLLRIGQCLVLEGDTESAQEFLQKAKELNPDEPEVRLWLGRALYFQGNFQGAQQELQGLHSSLKRSELLPVWSADVLLARSQSSRARVLLEKDIEEHPLHVFSLLKLSEIYLSKPHLSEKDLWKARSYLQLVLSRQENYSKQPKGIFETELGLWVDRKQEAQDKLDQLLKRIENRISKKEESV